MNAPPVYPITEPRWLTYAKAIFFVLPAVMAWGFACVLLAPKVREISFSAGMEASGFHWVWLTAFFLVNRGRSMFLAGILALLLLEFTAPGWRCRRRLTVGLGIWLANASVLLGLTLLLIVVLVAAPGLAHPR
jgi:hypothetical protein